MALLVGVMYHLLHIEIIRLLQKKRLDPEFSVSEINELDIYKIDPSDLPGLSEIKSDEQVWNFFCEPDYKYANSKKASRTTRSGSWKITGKPLKVKNKSGKVIGSKRILVYSKLVASETVKTDWVMHEFYVKDSSRSKKDFVFCHIEKNPKSKSIISTPNDDQHQPSQNLASDAETYATENASTEVESQQTSTHLWRNSSLEVESEAHNLVPDTGNDFVPHTPSMVEPELLSTLNLVSDSSLNHLSPNTSSMVAHDQLQSNHTIFTDPRNHFAQNTLLVESEVHNMVPDAGNDFVPHTSSMVEPERLSRPILISDSSLNHLSPNPSSMVAHDQLQSYHNTFTDPRKDFALYSCLLEDPQKLAELFGRNHSSVSAPQWRLINTEQGSSSSYLYGFDDSCTLSNSQFHGEQLEDVWIVQRNFQEKHPDEATEQTLPVDTDTNNTNAFVDGLFVDNPLDLN